MPALQKLLVRHADDIILEAAHGGAGQRQLVFSNPDIPNSKLEAVTIGRLPARGVFETHAHENIDELMIVVSGQAQVTASGKKTKVAQGHFVLFPSGLKHKIANTERTPFIAQFIRFRR